MQLLNVLLVCLSMFLVYLLIRSEIPHRFALAVLLLAGPGRHHRHVMPGLLQLTRQEKHVALKAPGHRKIRGRVLCYLHSLHLRTPAR